MVDSGRGDRERPYCERFRRERVDIEYFLHPLLGLRPVGLRQSDRDVGWPVDRDLRHRRARRVAPGDEQSAHVGEVIGMQMGKHDAVDIAQIGVLLQWPKGTTAQVQQDPAAVMLQQVAGCRGIGAGEGSGTADDGELHAITDAA